MAMAVYTAQLFEAVNSHHVSRGCDFDVHVPVLRSFMAKEAIADYRRRCEQEYCTTVPYHLAYATDTTQ